MRGKKIDTAFVAEFVTSCVKEGNVSSDTICARANEKIIEIDKQIKEVEGLKKLRSKLCDVLISFDTTEKVKDKSADRDILNFHSIDNKNLSLDIIVAMEKNNREISYDFGALSEFDVLDTVIFCIKQMAKAKIVKILRDLLVPGDNYWDYKAFLNDSLGTDRLSTKEGFIKYGTDN
jgi:hypothetical protein